NMLRGMYCLAPFLGITTMIQVSLSLGFRPTALLLIGTYGVASIAEVLLAVPAYHFFYMATAQRKALTMACFFATIGLGDLFSAVLNWVWSQLDMGPRYGELGYFVVLIVFAVAATVVFRLLMGRSKESLA